MKGRIMSIEDGKFYLITENGEFVSADASEGFEIGDEVEIKKDMPSFVKPLASIAAAVMIMAGGVYAYHIPVRYVDVCINPEIQLSLNILDRVVGVEGKNDDGVKIAESNKLKNDSVSDAIEEIVVSARSFGYMQNDDDSERDVIVSVYGEDAYKLSTKIPVKNVRVVDENVRQRAEMANIPVGKYVLMDELSKADENHDRDAAKKMSVKEIIDKINEAKTAPKPTAEPTPEPTAAPEVTPEPTIEPTPEPTPEPTKAPTVAKAKTATRTVAKVTKSTSKTTAKTTAVKATAKTTSKATTAKATTKPTVKATAKPTTAPKATTKPTTVMVSAAPEKAPKATALPSFDEVKRPSANGGRNDQSGKNTAENAPTSQQAQERAELFDADRRGNDNKEKTASAQPDKSGAQEREENKPVAQSRQQAPQNNAAQPDRGDNAGNTNRGNNAGGNAPAQQAQPDRGNSANGGAAIRQSQPDRGNNAPAQQAQSDRGNSRGGNDGQGSNR